MHTSGLKKLTNPGPKLTNWLRCGPKVDKAQPARNLFSAQNGTARRLSGRLEEVSVELFRDGFIGIVGSFRGVEEAQMRGLAVTGQTNRGSVSGSVLTDIHRDALEGHLLASAHFPVSHVLSMSAGTKILPPIVIRDAILVVDQIRHGSGHVEKGQGVCLHHDVIHADANVSSRDFRSCRLVQTALMVWFEPVEVPRVRFVAQEFLQFALGDLVFIPHGFFGRGKRLLIIDRMSATCAWEYEKAREELPLWTLNRGLHGAFAP